MWGCLLYTSHIHCRGVNLLARREAKDIWQNLYEYPLIETGQETELEVLQQTPAYLELMQEAGVCCNTSNSVSCPVSDVYKRQEYGEGYRERYPERRTVFISGKAGRGAVTDVGFC